MAQLIRLRPATRADAAAIAAVYNEGIADRVATFETAPRAAADVRAWLAAGDDLLVAALADRVVGFSRLSAYRDRDCYRGIREVSVYIGRAHRRRGVGRRLLAATIDRAGKRSYWKLVSRIFVENLASRALVGCLGFREVGVYHRHGQLDGVWRDVVIVERVLGASPPAHPSPTASAVSDGLSALARFYQLRSRDRTCRYGLTVSACYALEALVERGGAGVLDLATLLGVNKSTASRVVDALVAAGLARASTPADRRRRTVAATRRGADLARKIHRDIRAEHGGVLRQFDERTLSRFADLLAALEQSRGGGCSAANATARTTATSASH